MDGQSDQHGHGGDPQVTKKSWLTPNLSMSIAAPDALGRPFEICHLAAPFATRTISGAIPLLLAFRPKIAELTLMRGIQ
jgi:hypothetical protein